MSTQESEFPESSSVEATVSPTKGPSVGAV
jgi:hypothetical protein